jgi:hypothetical protein
VFVSSKVSAVPGFRSPGKLGRFLVGWPARQDRPDGLGTRQVPIARRKTGKDGAAGGWRGKAAGLSAGVRVAGGAPAVVPARTEDQSKPGTRGMQSSSGRRCCTAAATSPGPVSWSRAPDGSGARQGGPVTLPPGTGTAGTGRHRPDARWSPGQAAGVTQRACLPCRLPVSRQTAAASSLAVIASSYRPACCRAMLTLLSALPSPCRSPLSLQIRAAA